MTDILDLPPWKAISDRKEGDTQFITAEIEGNPYACPHCGVVHPKVHRFGKNTQEIADLPSHGLRVVVVAVTKRFRCLECNRTFYQSLPEVDEKHQATCRLIDYIRLKSLEEPFTDVAKDIFVHEKTVRNIFGEYVDWLDETIVFDTPQWLGLDELQLRHRTAPFGVMTNIKARTVFELLKNRSKETVSKAISSLKDRKQIELVCMDMHRPYQEVVVDLLGVPVIVDKFHVVRMANTALDSFRISMKDELPPAQRRQLKSDRFAMLARKGEVSEQQQQLILEIWFAAYPEMRVAYDLKERFYDIYELEKREEAEKEYDAWKKSIPSSMTIFKDLCRAVDNWRTEVFNYFDHHRLTNAFTESSNSKTRNIHDDGRGYSFNAIRAKVLYNFDNLREVRLPPKAVVKGGSLIYSDQQVHTSGIDMSSIEVFHHIGVPSKPLTRAEKSTLDRLHAKKKKARTSTIKS